ncbi:MAG TPA: hypothetical protein VM077_01235 [Candidatus Limnocylindrales bacterium]|nr:hypothetical protein [Candidatus Limnocylindrales bacterium]
MGIFGMGPQTDESGHKCEHCGKTIKPGEHFTKEGKKYCCEKCCGSVDKSAKKAAKSCEFC